MPEYNSADPAVAWLSSAVLNVVPAEQLLPALVAEFDRLLRGVDDVGEQHGGQHALDGSSGRTPVRNSSISSTKASASSVKNRWSAPSSSTNLAPGNAVGEVATHLNAQAR